MYTWCTIYRSTTPSRLYQDTPWQALYGLSNRIFSADTPAGPSSGHTLDLLLLGFVTKHSPGNYSAITSTHRVVWYFIVEVDVDVSKGQARPYPASRFPLLLHLWLPQWFSYSKQLRALLLDQVPVVAIEGTSPLIRPPPPVSKTADDLEVVFLASLQSTPARGPHYVFRQWMTHAEMMRRCSNRMTDGRLGCSHEMGMITQMLVSMMTWYQDEACKSRVGIMWADHVSGYVSRSCDW